MLENELYEPMRGWLEQYLNDKYKGYDIIAVDTSQERLDRALSSITQIKLLIVSVSGIMNLINTFYGGQLCQHYLIV